MSSYQNIDRYSWVGFLHLLRVRWLMIVLISSVVALVAAELWSRLPHGYLASVEMSVEKARSIDVIGRGAGSQTGLSTRLERENLKNALISPELLRNVAVGSGLASAGDPESLAAMSEKLAAHARIQVFPGETTTVRVFAPGRTGGEAVMVANAWARSFLAQRSEAATKDARERVERASVEIEAKEIAIRSLQTELMDLSKNAAANGDEIARLRRQMVRESNLLQALEARHLQLGLEVASARPDVRVVRKASLDAVMSRARNPVWVGAITAMALSIGILCAFFFTPDASNPGMAARISKTLHVPVVGFASLYEGFSSSILSYPTPSVEKYRDLRNRLSRLPAGKCAVLTFTPTSSRCNSSTVVAHLGKVFADGGHTVLIIDGNFRNPKLHESFDASHQPGLADFLSGEMRLEETVIKSRHPNLWVMPSGPLHADPCGLVSGRRMDDLFSDMKSRFDYVLISAPSILEVSEASILAVAADHVVAVSDMALRPLPRLKKIQASIELARGRMSGLILTSYEALPEPKEEHHGIPEAPTPQPRVDVGRVKSALR